MCRCSSFVNRYPFLFAGGTSRFPQTRSAGPLRGQAATPPLFRVYSALDLVGPAPAPRTLVLADDDRPRARDAADRRIARIVERVVRDLVHVDVRLDPLRVPIDDRLDLPDAVSRAPLDALRIRPGQRLFAANPGDPRVERRERAL